MDKHTAEYALTKQDQHLVASIDANKVSRAHARTAQHEVMQVIEQFGSLAPWLLFVIVFVQVSLVVHNAHQIMVVTFISTNHPFACVLDSAALSLLSQVSECIGGLMHLCRCSRMKPSTTKTARRSMRTPTRLCSATAARTRPPACSSSARAQARPCCPKWVRAACTDLGVYAQFSLVCGGQKLAHLNIQAMQVGEWRALYTHFAEPLRSYHPVHDPHLAVGRLVRAQVDLLHQLCHVLRAQHRAGAHECTTHSNVTIVSTGPVFRH
jgi:hypothetical protein